MILAGDLHNFHTLYFNHGVCLNLDTKIQEHRHSKFDEITVFGTIKFLVFGHRKFWTKVKTANKKFNYS